MSEFKTGDGVRIQLDPGGTYFRYDIDPATGKWWDRGGGGWWVIGEVKMVWPDLLVFLVFYTNMFAKRMQFTFPELGHCSYSLSYAGREGWPQPPRTEQSMTPKCECGGDACGAGHHSDWCPKQKYLSAHRTM